MVIIISRCEMAPYFIIGKRPNLSAQLNQIIEPNVKNIKKTLPNIDNSASEVHTKLKSETQFRRGVYSSTIR